MDLAHRQFIFNVVEYLNEFRAQHADQDLESLEVAAQCLQDTFQIDVQNDAQRQQYSIKPVGLLDVFQLGLARKDDVTKLVKDNLGNSILESKFQEYVGLLKSRNFFGGHAEGTAEYTDRYTKARAKFFEKYEQQSSSASPSSSPSPSPSSYDMPPLTPMSVSEPELSSEDKTKKAEEYKTAGNAKLTARNFQEAIDLYTKAIELVDSNAIYFANRAAAYTSLNQNDMAIVDSQMAISLNPKYGKGYSRLGLAYFQKEDYESALVSYEKALELEPGSATLKQSIESCKSKLGGGAAAGSGSPLQQAGGGGAPAGMEALLNNPMLRGLAEKFKAGGGVGGAGAGAGAAAGGEEDGEGGAGGMPDMSSMLNNPNLMNMAQSAMSQPGFAEMMNNPAMMNMAQSFMQNPEALSNIMGSLFGGAGAGGAGGQQ